MLDVAYAMLCNEQQITTFNILFLQLFREEWFASVFLCFHLLLIQPPSQQGQASSNPLLKPSDSIYRLASQVLAGGRTLDLFQRSLRY